MKKPIAIGGSAANPVTIGHYRLVEWLISSGKFSKVVWIVSGDRSDKTGLLDPAHRAALTRLSFPRDWFERKDVELVVSFDDVYGKNTPTIEWLERTQAENPGDEVIWYTGADSVAPKPAYGGLSEIEAKWHRGGELVKKWRFLIFPRRGFPDPRDLALPDNFQVAEVSFPEISSTEVRRKISAGELFDDLVRPEAAAYIREHRLYGYGSKKP